MGICLTDLKMVAKLSGWPTPDTNCDRGPDKAQGWKRQSQLAGWATPVERDHSRGTLPPRPTDTGVPLSQMVSGLAGWCSPQDQVSQILSGWDTPTAAEADKLTSRSKTGLRRQHGPTSESSTASTANPGVLDVRLPAWLMGYPDEWLRCSPGWESLVLIQSLLAESSLKPEHAASEESVASETRS